MKFLLGALALIAATSTWAYSFEEEQARIMAEGMDGKVEMPEPIEYGTTTRIITGHDGELSVEEYTSHDEHDSIEYDDYSDY